MEFSFKCNNWQLPYALFREDLRLRKLSITFEFYSEISIPDDEIVRLCKGKVHGFELDYGNRILLEDFVKIARECPHVVISTHWVNVPDDFDMLTYFSQFKRQ